VGLADKALTGLRWLFGAFFFATGVAIAIHVTTGMGGPPTQPTAAAKALDDALQASHIIDPLLAVSFLGGGGALALRRTTPLGLVLLAPAVAVIALFDTVLAGVPAVGLGVAAIWGVLALRFFDAFSGLWTYGAPMRVAKAPPPR
jgi:hypothetical protein